jgi:hypothetical protein
MIVIEVHGGVVQAVYADKADMPVEVNVLDFDNLEDEGCQAARKQALRQIKRAEREMTQVF